MSTDEEEYRGPATLRLADGPIAVDVRMSAHFEPVEGRFRWAGRTGPDDVLRERVGAGLRTAVIVIPEVGETRVKLSEPDPWGGVRISGAGTPPWFARDRAESVENPAASVENQAAAASGEAGDA